MKIIVKPKCADCGTWRIDVHCQAVLINGCDKYFCYGCWPYHNHDEGSTNVDKKAT